MNTEASRSSATELDKDPLTRRVREYLTTATGSEFYGARVEMLHHWQGADNLLWLVTDAPGTSAPQAATSQTATSQTTGADISVVKLFMDAGQARGRRQLDAQSTYAPRQIAPTPRWFDRYPQGLARQILVYTWIDADPLDAGDPHHLESLAQTIAQVHSADVDQVRRFCPHPINLDYFWRLEESSLKKAIAQSQQLGASDLARHLQSLLNRTSAWVQSALPLWETAAPAPVHGDLKSENCLVRANGTSVLVDWELYGLGDPALDIARFLFDTADSIADTAHTGFLAHYQAATADDTSLQRIDTYRRLLPVQAAVYLLNGVNAAVAHAAPGDTRKTGDTAAQREEIAPSLGDITTTIHACLQRADFDLAAGNDDLTTALQQWQACVTQNI